MAFTFQSISPSDGNVTVSTTAVIEVGGNGSVFDDYHILVDGEQVATHYHAMGGGHWHFHEDVQHDPWALGSIHTVGFYMVSGGIPATYGPYTVQVVCGAPSDITGILAFEVGGTISWTNGAATGLNKVSIVRTFPSAAGPYTIYDSVATTSVTESTYILPGTVWTATVTSYNSGGGEGGHVHGTVYGMGKAVLVSPEDDGSLALDEDGYYFVDWATGCGSAHTHYALYLDGDEITGDTGFTSWYFESIEVGIGWHTWRVDSINDGGGILEGEEWRFQVTVSFVYTQPVNESPTDGETDVARDVTLTWTGGDKFGSFGPAPSYIIVVNGERHGPVAVKSFSLPDLGYGQTYTWSVIVYGGSINSGYLESVPTTFTTVALTGYPTPGGGGTGDDTVNQKRRLIAAAEDKIWYEDI